MQTFLYPLESWHQALSNKYKNVENRWKLGVLLSKKQNFIYAKGKANLFTKSAVNWLLTVLSIKSINKKVNKKTCAYIQVLYFYLNQAYNPISLDIFEVSKDFLAKL